AYFVPGSTTGPRHAIGNLLVLSVRSSQLARLTPWLLHLCLPREPWAVSHSSSTVSDILGLLFQSDEQVIPARFPKTEVRAEEPKEATEVKDQAETQGQKDKKRGPCSNGKAASTSRPLETQGNLTSSWYNPRPLEGNVHLKSLTEKNQTDKAQVHALSFYSKGQGVASSHSPAGGILPFGKPDPFPTVLPAPVLGCSLWPDKSALKVLGKDHLLSSPGLLMVGKDMQPKYPAALGSSRSSPSRAAGHRSRRSRKRKLPGPPLQLQPTPCLKMRWDRDKQPPPAKLPRLSPEALWVRLPQQKDASSRATWIRT
uniref:Uncharacterized protein n=1 Tax=Pongo abelii TaxID=9601 RepID=A0A8I5T6K3_PONAB